VSRVGKQPITIPDAVKLDVKKNVVTAKGPKGELYIKVDKDLDVSVKEGMLTVKPVVEANQTRAKHGLYRTLLYNIIHGVTQGFEKRLEVTGVGYRAEMRGKNLLLSLGYSHDIIFKPAESIELSIEGNNVIVVNGIDKVLVGQVAAKIRSFRPPEPYKGKGIRYVGEHVRRKAGKAAA